MSRTILFFVVAIVFVGCSNSEKQSVQTVAEGILSISTQADSTTDFSDFELVLLTQTEGDVDTLGMAITDRTGHFLMEISSTEEGVYPLVVSRSNTQLAVEEFVVAAGDTAYVTASFPLEGRRVRIVSAENAAWSAYKNTKSLHNQSMLRMVQDQSATAENMFNVISRTSSLLWSLRDTYPDKLATSLASAEAIVMLEGWQDSLVVARLPELSIENSGIVDVVRAARRSVARATGQESSLALLRSYIDQLENEEQLAELHMELVVAHLDSFQNEQALSEALEIRRLYPDSDWAQWASRAAYEIENLRPGMTVPSFTVVTRDGDTISSDDLHGKFLILEFYEPTDGIFLKEIGDRNTIFQLLNPNVFQTLSISVEPDEAINDALFEESTPPGMFSFADGGRDSDIARLFNVQVIPTRFLIDPDGTIMSKYTRSSMPALEDDLITVVARLNELSVQPN